MFGVLLGKPDDMEVLKHFYKTTKPWGFWKDTFNCIVGIIWQMTFVLIPMYLLIRQYDYLSIVIGIMLVTTFILKKTWYDKMITKAKI